VVIVVLVRRDQDVSDDLFISSPSIDEKRGTYVSSTVMGWDVVCFYVVVVYLDCGFVDTYLSTSRNGSKGGGTYHQEEGPWTCRSRCVKWSWRGR
jgi:hypothetical protein